jgi:hypothetical protein
VRIVLDIERLVLDGLLASPDDGRRVSAALQTELQRLLAAGGIPKGSGVGNVSTDSVTASVAIGRAESSDVIGRRIASAVHAAIGQSISGPAPAAFGEH